MAQDRGFTLIETLVALAVLTVTLTSLYGLYAESLVRHRAAVEVTEALQVAQSTMEAIGIERPIPEGDDEVFRTKDERWLVRISGGTPPAVGSSKPMGRWVTVTVAAAVKDAKLRAAPVVLTSFKLQAPDP